LNAGVAFRSIGICDDEQRRGVTKRVGKADARRIAQVTTQALTEATRA